MWDMLLTMTGCLHDNFIVGSELDGFRESACAPCVARLHHTLVHDTLRQTRDPETGCFRVVFDWRVIDTVLSPEHST